MARPFPPVPPGPTARRRSLPLLAALALAAGSLTLGCDHADATSSSTGLDEAGLVAALRANGATVQEGSPVSQPFLAATGRELTVDGQSVQAFEYSSPAAATADASRVSSDGMTVGNTKVSWIAPPHFYRRDRMLVLYVGSDPAVRERLSAVLGPPFAGS